MGKVRAQPRREPIAPRERETGMFECRPERHPAIRVSAPGFAPAQQRLGDDPAADAFERGDSARRTAVAEPRRAVLLEHSLAGTEAVGVDGRSARPYRGGTNVSSAHGRTATSVSDRAPVQWLACEPPFDGDSKTGLPDDRERLAGISRSTPFRASVFWRRRVGETDHEGTAAHNRQVGAARRRSGRFKARDDLEEAIADMAAGAS